MGNIFIKHRDLFEKKKSIVEEIEDQINKMKVPYCHILLSGILCKEKGQDELETILNQFQSIYCDWHCSSSRSYRKEKHYYIEKPTDENDGFRCVHFIYNGIDIYNDNSDDIASILDKLITKLLEVFDDYINVVCVRCIKENGKEIIDYSSHLKINKKTKKAAVKKLAVSILAVSIDDSRALLPKSYDWSSPYFSPGFINQCNLDWDNFKDISDYLKNQIVGSKPFFDVETAGSVLSNLRRESFSLFHCEQTPFPLPIILKPAKDMPQHWSYANWDLGKNEDYAKLLEEIRENGFITLGYYSHEDEEKCWCYGPHIALCPDNIEKAAGKDIKLVYLIVLIHELAHAMMDKYRASGSMQSLFAHAMEESLANMITLQWFEKYDPKNLKKVKSFMDNQPTVYKFGIEQYRANVDWRMWCYSYKNMHHLLKEWFDSFFIKKRKRKPKKSFVLSSYNQLFRRHLEEAKRYSTLLEDICNKSQGEPTE